MKPRGGNEGSRRITRRTFTRTATTGLLALWLPSLTRCATMRDMTASITAQRAEALTAVLEGETSLRYSPTAVRPELPAHLRAGSAIRRWAGRLVVVQDDVHALGFLDEASGDITALLLPPGADGSHVFGDDLGNKALKMDLEACITLPDGRLVALGSGSTPARERVVIVDPSGDVRLFNAHGLYAALHARPDFTGSELNIEGATVVGDALLLFQRGNGAPRDGKRRFTVCDKANILRSYAFFRAVFDEVNQALGEDLARTMFEGPDETLRLTENAQPALMAVSMAIVRVLEREGGYALDGTTGEVVVPHGSLGFRYGDDGLGKWNLDLGEWTPVLTVAPSHGEEGETAVVALPRFDSLDGHGEVLQRGVPVHRVGEHQVCTVFDLMLAQYGVRRPGLPGDWPTGYDDPDHPYTPAWQESITGVAAQQAIRVAREFARNAEDSGGRSMIIMGAGICQWFHGDATYRAVLALVLLTGAMGRNGGGWAHYVGQEKCRPVTGWSALAMATDWSRPPRQMPGTSYWYVHTDQWRYDGYRADALASPLGRGRFDNKHTMDVLTSSAAMGWTPFYPQFDRSSLDVADDARAAGKDVASYVSEQLGTGGLKFAVTDPDNPANWPRVLSVWRANLLGSSSKGNEYFLRHLLGTDSNLQAHPAAEALRPREVFCPNEIPEGKLDLLMSIDFRMTSTTLLSDVVLPAATWYEKHDLSSTDMHPFVHAFTPAVDPPWETHSDFEAFGAIARAFSALAAEHLGSRTDVVLGALQHDTPGAMAYPGGAEKDWRARGEMPIPGKTMGPLTVVERDYPAVADKWAALGPLVEQMGLTTKGITVHPDQEVKELGARFGVMSSGAAQGRPAINTAARMADAILALSGTTNGRLAVEGFRELERRTGRRLVHLAEGSEERRISFADTQARPVPVITSPEWSGSETGGRRYAPFTVNIEHLKPFHTLTGRMHFYLDHDWLEELGEQLPIYRPPLDMSRLFGDAAIGSHEDGVGLTVRYLTPHSKWSIHSEYQDNLFMLSLSRGGPTMWMSPADAAKIAVRDNDWVEAVNRNGVLVCRAIVSHRMPEGVVFVYHAQERTIDVPLSETTGKRGGIHNSLTRLLIKPSHLAGGYAQNAFAFNYLGPTGNQRDEVTVVRRRSQEVAF